MHGLINRAIQRFLTDTYGAEAWAVVAERAGIGPEGFEPMKLYDDGLTEAMLAAAAEVLRRPRAGLLEDLGTHLVSGAPRSALRRLLRFGGATFAEFVQTLDEVPGRARLALPELALPQIDVLEQDATRAVIACRGGPPGIAHVAAGMLRAMADDYGALVLIEALDPVAAGASPAADATAPAAAPRGPGAPPAPDRAGGAVEHLVVRLLDAGFSDARPFSLVAGAA